MIRILYITDTHLRGTAPRSRKDDFAKTVQTKLKEVVSIANEAGAAVMIHGGDLFDLPEPGLGHVGEYMEILSNIEVPLYVVPGNHDMYGHNPETLQRTLLGFLEKVGTVRLLGRDPIFLEEDEVKIQLTGQGFHAEIDRRNFALDYAVQKFKGGYAIHVVHGMMLPRKIISSAPFLPAATAAEDVLSLTEADLTLGAHYHMPFEVKLSGKSAVNPGALVRMTALPVEIERMPQVLLVECDRNELSYRFILLSSARSGSEVLDRSYIEAEQAREEAREAFLIGLTEFSRSCFSTVDPESVLRESLRRVNAGMEVEGEAWKRFQESCIESENFLTT